MIETSSVTHEPVLLSSIFWLKYIYISKWNPKLVIELGKGWNLKSILLIFLIYSIVKEMFATLLSIWSRLKSTESKKRIQFWYFC